MSQQHNSTKRKLKIAGFILLAVGAVFALIGFVDFFSAFANPGGKMPSLFWMLFLGIPTAGAGAMLVALGYKREISKYFKNEAVPVINEAAEELTPALKSVKRALKDDEPRKNETVCKCGAHNPAGMRFCGQCGKPLVRICPHCGDAAEPDDNFCGKCGKPLE